MAENAGDVPLREMYVRMGIDADPFLSSLDIIDERLNTTEDNIKSVLRTSSTPLAIESEISPIEARLPTPEVTTETAEEKISSEEMLGKLSELVEIAVGIQSVTEAPKRISPFKGEIIPEPADIKLAETLNIAVEELHQGVLTQDKTLDELGETMGKVEDLLISNERLGEKLEIVGDQLGYEKIGEKLFEVESAIRESIERKPVETEVFTPRERIIEPAITERKEIPDISVNVSPNISVNISTELTAEDLKAKLSVELDKVKEEIMDKTAELFENELKKVFEGV